MNNSGFGVSRDYVARVFSFHGSAIGVCCNNVDHLEWLCEFLEPHFSVAEINPAKCLVNFEENSRLYYELLGKGPDPDKKKIAFLGMDTTTISLPKWSSMEGTLTLFDEEFNVFYIVDQLANSLSLISKPSNLWSRIAMMRIIREFVQIEMTRRGDVLLHGSAVALNGEAIAMIGPKRSGKTSLLLYLLSTTTVQYISNDRLHAQTREQDILLSGMPTVIKIRGDALQLFPDLFENYPDVREQCAMTYRERGRHQPKLTESLIESYLLNPRQLCQLTDSQQITSLPLKAVLLPRVDTQSKGINIKPLDQEGALTKLSKGMYRADFNTITEGMLTSLFTSKQCLKKKKVNKENDKLNLFTRLLKEHRCYECVLGADVYENSRGSEILLNSIYGQV